MLLEHTECVIHDTVLKMMQLTVTRWQF